MQKNVNPYRIYLKATREWVEVSEDYYRSHTRYYDAFRKRHQAFGQCVCPKNEFWLCDGDCYNCEFHRADDKIPLDYTTLLGSFSIQKEPVMDNKQFYIEIDGEQIPVSEEIYRAYKRPLWSEHKRKEREKRCRSIIGNRCTNDCRKCNKQQTGSVLSLDKFAEDGFDIADPIDCTQPIEDEQAIEALHIALAELTSLDLQIVNLFSVGKSEREIAAMVGMSQKGVNKRKTRIFADLRERLKNFL